MDIHCWRDGVPCFLSYQVEEYGMPDLYGYTEYYVLDQPVYCQSEAFREVEAVQVHRYSRKERFRMILLQLIGWRGKVPVAILELADELKLTADYVWSDMRTLLKTSGYTQYYNRIPRILYLMGYADMIHVEAAAYERIMERFQKLEYLFSLQTERKYFPSLRYVCYRLLAEEGLQHSYPVGFIITERKRVLLDSFWNKFFI